MARNTATMEDVVTDNGTVETDPRIPQILSEQSILADFCKQYLNVADEIAAYNKEVLAEKSSDWTPVKVILKAREFASPEDANAETNEDIKKALDVWEELVRQAQLARKAVLDLTSKELGITLSATSERSAETEAPLKDRRKFANEIGTQLQMISKLATNSEASAAVAHFLSENPLPVVGRDQVRTFGSEEKSTPKYRVTVSVSRDGSELFREDGFTKTALKLVKYYERGQAPKADFLRSAWESVGNNGETTVQPVVEFEHEGLNFTITKK